jgi:glutathione S-transferase
MDPSAALHLTVLSLRYSSWSMRPWLALTHADARFTTETVELPHMQRRRGSSGVVTAANAADAANAANARNSATAATAVNTANSLNPETTSLADRRALGSVRGLFPVLRVDGVPIHESLAICEYVADVFPEAGLWPGSALRRAQARAISCEMVSGFVSLRMEMQCHLFARVPSFSPSAAALADIARVFEIWEECLERSGGPFLFGRFGIADAMFYPVLTRFRTYAVELPDRLEDFGRALDDLPAVRSLIEVARSAPRTLIYDDYVEGLGGDPDAALRSS